MIRYPKNGPFTIRVYGDPQPFPKKEMIKLPGGRWIPGDCDYRTRKNPVSNQTEKYDKGYKRRWMSHVGGEVLSWMNSHAYDPFPQNHPVAMGLCFYLPKAQSNKLEFPSQAPDEDNYLYAVRNALKRTPAKKGREGKFPDGILYYDDDQVVWQLQPAGTVWATEQEAPGLLITFQCAVEIGDTIRKLTNTEELRLI